MTKGLRFSIVVAEDDEDDRILMDEAFVEIGCGAEIKKFISGEDMLRYLDSSFSQRNRDTLNSEGQPKLQGHSGHYL